MAEEKAPELLFSFFLFWGAFHHLYVWSLRHQFYSWAPRLCDCQDMIKVLDVCVHLHVFLQDRPTLSSVSEGSVTQKSFRATSLVLTWLVMNLTKYNWAVLHWVSFYSASTYTGGRHDLECFCFPSSIQLYLLIKNCFFSLFIFFFFLVLHRSIFYKK